MAEPRIVKYQLKHAHKFKGPCPKCGATHWSVAKMLCSSGQVKYPWYCRMCGHRSHVYEPNNERIIYTNVFDYTGDQACEKCGKQGAEWHHWMPRHLAGDDADNWPIGLLCQVCHDTWHRIVTPNMSEVDCD